MFVYSFLQAIETGSDGKIYISGYMAGIGEIFDPYGEDSLELFNIGQVEGFGSVGDKMYAGVYR